MEPQNFDKMDYKNNTLNAKLNIMVDPTIVKEVNESEKAIEMGTDPGFSIEAFKQKMFNLLNKLS